MKKLINSLVLSYRHCQFMSVTVEVKQLKREKAEPEFSALIISVDENNKEGKTLALAIALAELVVVDINEDN